MRVEDTFGGPLRPDNAICLRPPNVQPPKEGPLPKVQFVVEIAGPRTLLAASGAALLSSQWQAALGRPQVWVMAPADRAWRKMIPNEPGSYDSLALTWDFITPKGQLSGASAKQILTICDGFATKIGRRAMAMPMPDQVDTLVRHWAAVNESLDAGFVMVLENPDRPMPERDVWRLCTALGLTFGPKGSFDWMIEEWPLPLLSITPNDADAFSLAAVQSDTQHDAVAVGFSVARSPAPQTSLDACFYVASQFQAKMGCVMFDEDGKQIGDEERAGLTRDLQAGVQALTQAGVPPGSAEAIKVFGAAPES